MHHHQILLTPQLKPLTLNSKPDIMYCKKCGKVIPDDSLFCQYCGEQLSDSKPPKKQMQKSPLSRFQSLSRGWQICIMSYVCWVFLWIILCIDGPAQSIDIVIFVFILPILALFIWYYFTRLRKGAKNKIWKSPLSRFQSLSRGWQICIMSYVCWVFLWIILLCIDAYALGIDFVIFVFLLPILALFIWDSLHT